LRCEPGGRQASPYPATYRPTAIRVELHRYWFKFDLKIGDPHPVGVLPGCGVTARDREDAIKLLKERVFTQHPFPNIVSVQEDVDVSSLDSKHVRPNMENPVVRGVWFPRGSG
jgi:hypothetical protein